MLTAAAIVAGICAAISAIAGDRGGIADLSATTEKKPAVIVTTPAESTQTPEPTAAPARYPLSASERDTVERVVMAEAGGECYEGQVLVAQCILNAAEKLDQRPPEVFETLSYAGARPDPTQSVKDAVSAVFDDGEIYINEPILYFYAPARVTSEWHESQIFVIERGGHRFFKERLSLIHI